MSSHSCFKCEHYNVIKEWKLLYHFCKLNDREFKLFEMSFIPSWCPKKEKENGKNKITC